MVATGVLLPKYNAPPGSLPDQWLKLRSKIQIFAGGFGNGKTTGAAVKALSFMRDYPGSIGLIARATEERLQDSVVECLKEWTPPAWIKSWTKRGVVLHNGSQAWFRYSRQKGKRDTNTTSNLLSTTFDWILVDQIDDKEITYKDVMDLLGRLRGQRGKYIGKDPTMPETGPRVMMLTLNPTRSWPYHKFIRPIQIYKKGGMIPERLLDKTTGKPIIELVEGSTLENVANLPADFVESVRSAYQDSYKERYFDGSWTYSEDQVYPAFQPEVHVVPHSFMLNHFHSTVKKMGGLIAVREGFDYGLHVPACYLFGFEDESGIVHVLYGFYQSELSDEDIVRRINKIRLSVTCNNFPALVADPSIFKRQGKSQGVGISIAGRLSDLGLECCKANNDIRAGVNVVKGYVKIDSRRNPYTGEIQSPGVFFSDELVVETDDPEEPVSHFLSNEMLEYRRARDSYNEVTDDFVGRNDHAVDALRYLLARQHASKILVTSKPVVRTTLPAELFQWRPRDARVSRHR